MPPKKQRSRRAASSSTNEQTEQVSSAAVQMESVSNLELIDCKNQIELLLQQIEEYKRKIDSLETENDILKRQNGNNLNVDVMMTKDTEKSGRQSGLPSPFPPGMKIKGCTCKGNCSSKICGCVKKNNSCNEFCKCNQSMCKNQNADKENIKQVELSEDGQKVMEKLESLVLNQEKLHASTKKAKRSIFSPFSATKGIDTENKMSPASPLSFVTRRRLFTQNSDEITDIKSDTEHERNSTLEENQDQAKELDKSNSHCSYQHPQIKTEKEIDKEAKAIIIKNQKELKIVNTRKTKKNGKLQKMDHIDNENIDVEKSKALPVLNFNGSEGSSSEDKSFIFETSQKIIHSPLESVAERKTKTIASDEFSTFEQNQPKSHKVTHSPQLKNSNIQNIENNQRVDSDIVKEDDFLKPVCNPVQHSPQSSFNKSLSKSSTSTSENSSNEISSTSCHPMMPKRQLPRSPPIIAKGLQIESRDSKKFSPPKQELTVAEVDWEQHQAKLVTCKICKRKFWPHRLEIHTKSCKGI